jgi:LCP family protein required for cell wall assembly
MTTLPPADGVSADLTADPTVWLARCVVCGSDLGAIPDGRGGAQLDCRECGHRTERRDGIWDAIDPAARSRHERFLADYLTVRRGEGRGSDDPEYYRRLPDARRDDPVAAQWRIRRRTWKHLRRHVLRRLGPRRGSTRAPLRVVDLGAGVGWLSNRLAAAGHRPVAIDVSVDERDGLGAARHYDPTWPLLRADFDRLPLADAQADVVLFDASLHYSADYAATLREALRVIVPEGRVVVLETPLYRNRASGDAMVAERHAAFAADFGTRSDSVPAREFLTPADLTELSDEVGVEWQVTRPWYGLRWALRPLRAKLARRRAPSRFPILVAHRRGVPVRAVRDWPRRTRRAIAATAGVLALATAGEAVYLYRELEKIHRVSVPGLGAPTPTTATSGATVATVDNPSVVPTRAFNVLLVGVDSIAGLPADDPRRVGRDPNDRRTDTMMLVRIDPGGTTSVLSIPRDLWVPLGGEGEENKINAALPIGGSELLVATVRQNLFVPIDHYVEIDFAQFERLIDLIGGVPIPFDTPVRDTEAGFTITEPSCFTLDGQAALVYVRARHFEVFVEGEWVEDPLSDLSRMRRQQDFLRRALARAVSRVVRNPLRFNRLVHRGLQSITVDESLSNGTLLRIANEMRSFDSDELVTASIPVVGDETDDGLSIVRMVPEDAAPMLDIFRGIDPDAWSNVAVDVSGPGRDEIAAGLTARGVSVLASAQTTNPGTRTVVRHRPNDAYRAELLSRWFDGEVDLVEDATYTGAGIALELGSGSDAPTMRESARPGRSYRLGNEDEAAIVPGETNDICD